MRSNFNRSALVRQLAGWLPAQADAPRQDVAERLGQWLNVADAITLHAAQQSIPSAAAVRRTAARPASPQAVNAEYQQVRATLVKAITTREAGPAIEADADFALFHQRHQDQQRRMDMSIEALRGHVRHTLSQTTPRLAQLAALDALLDQMLGGREQQLLAGVPAFLKTRFKQLRQQQPEDWLPIFEHDFQQALLAELDVRLQPVAGMIEALSNEVKTHP